MSVVALKILEDCINCDVCVYECPNDAIFEGEEIYIINAERCTECVGFFDEPQCMVVCPVDCIEKDPDQAESEVELLAKHRNLHSQTSG